MRSLTITAAVAAAAAVLLASPGATRLALESERGVVATVAPAGAAATGDACENPAQQPDAAPRGHKVSDISWFQGTLEEAFTRHTHSDHRPWLHF
jgi:hypothetical protein